MSGTKDLKVGDPCPACGGTLTPAAVPTDEQYRKAFDRENPIALAPGTDTASPETRADLGALSVCGRCGYQARFPVEPPPLAEGERASARRR